MKYAIVLLFVIIAMVSAVQEAEHHQEKRSVLLSSGHLGAGHAGVVGLGHGHHLGYAGHLGHRMGRSVVLTNLGLSPVVVGTHGMLTHHGLGLHHGLTGLHHGLIL